MKSAESPRIGEATFDWFAGISLNNNREQFLATKDAYEASVRAPFVALLTELSAEFGGTPKVFRPNRDIRFSADKRPYKTNVSGFLEGSAATCYLDLSLDGLMAATGYYQMAKDQIERYRGALTGEEFLAVGDELRKIVEQVGAEGTGLKTVPRGVPKDHPNADLLRWTSLTVSHVLSVEQVLQGEAKEFAAGVWTKAAPLNAWLKSNVGPTTLEW